MLVSVRAVSAEITCRTASGSNRRVSRPFTSKTDFTSLGRIIVPPLATAPNAVTIWSAVTDTSWPSDIVGSDSADHLGGSRSWPRLSPDSPTPVGRPKPNAVM